MQLTARLRVTIVLLTLLAVVAPARGQTDSDDSRIQYPAWLANSYVSVNIGAVDYLFTSEQLRSGLTVRAVDTPHTTVRLALFGHEFNQFIAVQGSYMRPVQYVSYLNVNGAPEGDHHHVRVNSGSLSTRVRFPIGRMAPYGELGVAFTSRTGFLVAGVPAVTDAHFASPLAGLGLDYRVNDNWELTGGVVATPGKAAVAQRRTVLTSAGFRYTMRPLTPEQVQANRDPSLIFPRQSFQVEYSFPFGYAVNRFVSSTVPIFWGGNAQTEFGVAPHYERNVFHTKRLFALDIGTSAGIYVTRQQDDHFYTASVYPLFRFTFLRRPAADLYFAYSAAGPTYISRVVLDGLDTGRHFTFQDFMGVGVFTGRARQWTVGMKINHFSNGNIFPQNAAVTVPLTVSVGYAF